MVSTDFFKQWLSSVVVGAKTMGALDVQTYCLILDEVDDGNYTNALRLLRDELDDYND